MHRNEVLSYDWGYEDFIEGRGFNPPNNAVEASHYRRGWNDAGMQDNEDISPSLHL